MDIKRTILFVALSMVIMLLYSAWQTQFAPLQGVESGGVDVPQDMGSQGKASLPPPKDLPGAQTGLPGATNIDAVPGARETPMDVMTSSLKSDQRIHVITDVLDIEIDTVGGDIRRASLLAYPIKVEVPEVTVQLFDDRFPKIFIAQSGVLSNDGSTVDHHAIFTPEASEYKLGVGDDTLVVPLKWIGDNGFAVTKTYTFSRDSYVVDMDISVTNGTSKEWVGRMYRQLQRTDSTDENQSGFINTYTGGVVSTTADVYKKIDFDEMDSWKPEQSYDKGGWAAIIQHYFFAAWIPSQEEFNHYYTVTVENPRAPEDNRYIIGLQTAEARVPNGQSKTFSSKLYLGPKDQKRLVKVAPHLELTVDYGILTVLSQPLYWVMDKIHSFVNNWGWTIVLVTVLIKAVFYKLSEMSYRSMARMRKFQPRLAALKERYGDDRQRMSKAMMEIYKKEKINPLGGCLPIVVQIPVFISLYWVLLESIELRQADFIFWIHDLSSKDPFYVLPVLMGISMFLQHKLNPAPLDPVQQKLFQILPLVFTVFFAFFPAGLVLYWVVNNILAISQQYYITRKIEQET